MESLVLLIGATLAIVIAAVSFLFGRQATTNAPPLNTSGLEPEVAAEIARLQERERTLSADVARQADELQRFNEALLVSQREHGASRERLAVAEERAAGLGRTLANERESSEAARRALSVELDAAIESRDRLQTSLANTSQQLAAADERVAGFQRNVAAEKEGSDATRRSLSTELDQMTGARDRLQASLADISQKLAAAEERVSGLTRTLATDRESNDTARRALSAELDAVIDGRDRLHVVLAETSQKLAGAQQMEQELRGRISRAEEQVANWGEKAAAYEEQLHDLRQQIEAKDRDVAASLEREFSLVRDLAERDKKQLEGLRERLAAEFETIASRLLASSANPQPAKAKDSASSTLDPLSARIVDFQQKVQAVRLEARQSETARAIAEQAGQLYDSLVAAVAELNEVSSKLRAVGEAHDDALRKLTSGKGNAVSRAEQLKSLGGASTESRVVPLKGAAEK
jgi:DNA recombination protein RmuC